MRYMQFNAGDHLILGQASKKLMGPSGEYMSKFPNTVIDSVNY